MRYRPLAIGVLLVAITLGMAQAVPAQAPARRMIEVTMSEYKYEPNQIRFNEGDTVVLKLTNAGPRMVHNLSSRFWLEINLTVRGDGRQGISEDRKWIALDPGKSAEIEFVAKGRGSFAILCSIFDHASRGHTGAFFVQAAGSP
ncbi:MAG: cupredoxin domain-containing protein [Armatimonadota bacterium]